MLSCLPPFPALALTATVDNLRSSYAWAVAMVELYGENTWHVVRAERGRYRAHIKSICGMFCGKNELRPASFFVCQSLIVLDWRMG
jgi:hypothetical protein